MNSWELEDFNYGDIGGQIIRFNVFKREYLMLFNPIDDLYDSSTKANLDEENLGYEITTPRYKS